MKRVSCLLGLLVLLPLAALADQPATQEYNALGILRNARFVYVTSYDGPQFSTHLWPQDYQAIAAVQNALQKDGYTIVYSPRQADMIAVVETWPSSDLLAIYQGGRYGYGDYLWRAEAKEGLAGSNPVLVQQFEHALERAGANG